MYMRILFLILFSIMFSVDVHANVDVHSEVFIDESKELSLDEVVELDLFKKYPSTRGFGFKDHAVWVKITIDADKKASNKNHFLEYKFSKIESLDYYIFENSILTQTYKMGSKVPYTKRIIDSRNLYIPLETSSLSSLVIYARLYHISSIPVDFEVINIDELTHAVENYSVVLGILYGVFLIMAVYNFMLFIVTKEKYYLTYVFLVLANLLYQASYVQTAYKHIWSNATEFNLYSGSLFAMLYIGFGVVFISQLLEITPKRLPKIYYLIYSELVAIIFLTLSMVYSFEVLENRALTQTLNLMVLYPYIAIFITILFAAIYLAINNERTAKIFAFVWGIFIVAILIFIANILGYIEYSNNIIYLLEFASILEVSLLALILADKLNNASSVSEKLTANNKNLELLVTQRTEELHNQIQVDVITKLKNRYAFFKQFERSEYNLILLIDINGFKQLNDFYGNSVGNEILFEFSKFLSNYALLESLDVYRMSADEFVLLSQSEELFGVTEFEILGYEFSHLLSKKKFLITSINDEIELEVTIAIAEGSINQADMALVEAKSKQSKLVVYSSEVDKTTIISKNLEWKRRIKEGLENEKFVCFYQPILNADEKVIKYELLMRLKDESGSEIKYISPFFFLEYAVKANQYIELSRYIIENGIKQFNKDAKLSINLSYLEIKDEDFIGWIREVIHRNNFFNKIVFEILESADIENYDLINRVRDVFKYDGVEIAIDDFGSGYSNFSHILELKPNYLKLDGSIIKNIDTDTTAYQLVKSLSKLAHELGIKTIAEYVHSKEVFEICKEIGIDEFQGFYFSEPKLLTEVMS